MTDRRAFMSSMMRAGVALPTLRASAFSTLFRAEDLVRDKSALAGAPPALRRMEQQRAWLNCT